MLHSSPGTYGATTQSRHSKKANPYGFLRDLMDANPDATWAELCDMSAEIILAQMVDGDLTRFHGGELSMFYAMHKYWFTNSMRNLTRGLADDDVEASVPLPDEGRFCGAPASSPEATTEAGRKMPDEGHSKVASASPTTAGGANVPLPDEGLTCGAPPARGPSEAELRGMLLAKNAAARTVLHTYLIDGKPVGDWTIEGAEEGVKIKGREKYILQRAAAYGRSLGRPGATLLGDFVKPDAMSAWTEEAIHAS